MRWRRWRSANGGQAELSVVVGRWDKWKGHRAYGDSCDIRRLDDGLGAVCPDLLGERVAIGEWRVVARYRHQGRVPPSGRVGLLEPRDKVVEAGSGRPTWVFRVEHVCGSDLGGVVSSVADILRRRHRALTSAPGIVRLLHASRSNPCIFSAAWRRRPARAKQVERRCGVRGVFGSALDGFAATYRARPHANLSRLTVHLVPAALNVVHSVRDHYRLLAHCPNHRRVERRPRWLLGTGVYEGAAQAQVEKISPIPHDHG